MKFLINEQLGQHRYKTKEGYLVCVDAIIARTGKQNYRKNELFTDAEDDETEISVDRPYKEVFDEKTIASFENKPFVDEHPEGDVNVDNYRELSIGYIRDVHEGSDNGKPVLLANIIVTDPDAIREIENNEKNQLSCGYDCDIKQDENGNYYQSGIRGNHLALCETGRAGNARIQDSVKDTIPWKVGDIVSYYKEYDNGKIKEISAKIVKIQYNIAYFDNGDSIPLLAIKNDSVNSKLEDSIDKVIKDATTTRRMFRENEIGDKDSWFGTTEWGTPKGSLFIYKENNKIIATPKWESKSNAKEFNNVKELNQWLNSHQDSIKDDYSLKELENELDNLSCVAFCYTQGDKIIIDSTWRTTQRKTEKDRMDLMMFLNKWVGKENYNLRYEKLQWRDNSTQCSIRFSLTLKYTRDLVKDDDLDNQLIKEENEAVESYENALSKTNKRRKKEVYNHILGEELEHIEELEHLEEFDDSIKDVNPKEGESKPDFLQRFMRETESEYPDIKQRFAVANSYWERKNKDSVKDGNTIKSSNVYEVLDKYLQWEGIYGYTRNIIEKAKKGYDELDKYLEYEGIYGYTNKIMNIIRTKTAYIDDSIKDEAKTEIKVKVENNEPHYEGYVNGKFICSGDTKSEVEKDIKEYLKGHKYYVYYRSNDNQNNDKVNIVQAIDENDAIEKTKKQLGRNLVEIQSVVCKDSKFDENKAIKLVKNIKKIKDDYSGFLGNYGFDYLKGNGDYEYWYLKYNDEDFNKLVNRIRKEYPMLIISSSPERKTIYIQKSMYKK